MRGVNPIRSLAMIAAMLPTLITGTLRAQHPTFEQRQAMDSVASLLARYGQEGDSAWLAREFAAGRIYFREGSETGVDRRDHIFVNTALGDQIRTADAMQRFRAMADLAATLLHERVHVGQSHASQGASRLRNLGGGDHPSEVEAWRVGFNAYREFIAREAVAMEDAKSEADKERAAMRMRELIRSFEQYRAEYERPGNHFGAMQFGDGRTLAEVSESYGKRMATLDATLARADFRTTVSPYRIVVALGEAFTVTASTVGGAFNEARRKDQASLYTYQWYANGVRIAGASAAMLQRTARSAEVITVVAVDRLGAKSSTARCEVVLAEPAAPVRAPSIPEPAATPRARTATGGQWVRVRTDRVDRVLDPARVRSHSFSDGSYTAEVLYPRQAEPTVERASWPTPGGTLTPGTELAMNVNGAASMMVQVTRGNPSTEALSTEDRPGVWKVTPGSGADQVFVTVKAGGRYVQCTVTYVYEWRP